MTETQHNCNICGETYLSQIELSRHQYSCHRDGHTLQECEFCDQTFYHYQDLIQHQNSEHRDSEPAVLRRSNVNHLRASALARQRRQNQQPEHHDPNAEIDNGQFCTSAFREVCRYNTEWFSRVK